MGDLSLRDELSMRINNASVISGGPAVGHYADEIADALLPIIEAETRRAVRDALDEVYRQVDAIDLDFQSDVPGNAGAAAMSVLACQIIAGYRDGAP